MTSPPAPELTQSDRLRSQIEVLLPILRATGRRLIEHPRIADLYPEYLITMHGIIRASVPLMQTALARAEREGDDDPVSAQLAGYLEEHIPEEQDHDEWLLQDLETLGVQRSSVLTRAPSPTVAALVGAQYYWILHYHPVSLLGYIALLEGYPPVQEDVEELIARTGYPREAFRTLAAHAELDLGHRDDLNAAIDALPLTDQQAALLALNALYAVHMTTRALTEVVDRTGTAIP